MESNVRILVDQVRDRLKESWNISNGDLEWVWDRFNLIFKWIGPSNFYIKVTSQKARSFAEVKANLAFQCHLWELGCPVPEPIRSREGGFVKTVELTDRVGFLSVSRAVPGEPISLSTTNPEEYAAWGRALGQLHHAARTFDVSSAGYEFLTHEIEWEKCLSALGSAAPQIRAILSTLGDWREDVAERSAQPFLTHGDMNAGNALWNGEQVHLIDFDEPIIHWAAADVARPFRETASISDDDREQLLTAFLGGYRSILPDENFQRSDLSHFVTLKNLEMFAWVLQRSEEEVAAFGFSRNEAMSELERRILSPLI